MESVTSSSSMSVPQEAYNYDEFFMQQSLQFLDSLKELKNLKKQLYSAAEYFEQSYSKDDQEQLVMDALKDYAIKALINTVDHLGSMAYKVNNFLDEKVGEVTGIELRVSCIEQRERTCRELINYTGRYQQSLALKTPRHHKQYIFPASGAAMHAGRQTESKFHSKGLCAEADLHQFKNAFQVTGDSPSWLVRYGPSASPLSQSSSSPKTFSFARIASNRELEKPRVSPHHFPLVRWGSLVTRSPTPNSSLMRSGSLITRSPTPNSSLMRSGSLVTGYHNPNSFNAKRQYPLEPRRTISFGTHAEWERTKDIQQYSKEIEQYTSKSKRLFRALLSVRKSKKDGTLYKYLDEY